MSITRKIWRAQEKKQKKEDKKLIRKLQLSDFTYQADDRYGSGAASLPDK